MSNLTHAIFATPSASEREFSPTRLFNLNGKLNTIDIDMAELGKN
jgi:hypothetical protein